MAFRLKSGSTSRELRRVVRAEFRSALSALSGREPSPTDVHEARKSIKKIRSVLRLLRTSLGSDYTAENDRMRRAGRLLGGVRDATVVQKTFETLFERNKTAITGSDADAVAEGLRRWKRKELAAQGPVVGEAVKLIRESAEALPSLVERKGARKQVERGLVQGYRQARRASKGLTPSSSPEEFHLLRRRVKAHGYHVRLFERRRPAVKHRSQHLKVAESDLGEDHDLSILADVLLTHPDRFGGPSATASILGVIQQRQLSLRTGIREQVRELFRSSPRKFAKRARRWSAR